MTVRNRIVSSIGGGGFQVRGNTLYLGPITHTGGAGSVLTGGNATAWIAARTLTGTADVYITPGMGA